MKVNSINNLIFQQFLISLTGDHFDYSPRASKTKLYRWKYIIRSGCESHVWYFIYCADAGSCNFF